MTDYTLIEQINAGLKLYYQSFLHKPKYEDLFAEYCKKNDINDELIKQELHSLTPASQIVDFVQMGGRLFPLSDSDKGELLHSPIDDAALKAITINKICKVLTWCSKYRNPIFENGIFQLQPNEV